MSIGNSRSCWPFAKILAALAAVTALWRHGVYTSYVTHDVQPGGGWELISTALMLAIFAVAPIVTLVGVWRRRVWGLWSLLAFVIAALSFGVSVVPLVPLLFAPGLPQTVVVILLNCAFLLLVAWLLHRCGAQPKRGR
jgi:hypothetical protein